jgi:hypothetical protein
LGSHLAPEKEAVVPRLIRVVVLASFVTVASVPTSAAPLVIDFSAGGPVGMLAASFTVAGVFVEGLYRDGAGNWLPSPLFRRNEPGDHGLGVCSEGSGACGTGSGMGDWNELSNLVSPEVIRLTLPDNYEWVSFQLSSLDSNGFRFAPEVGQLFAAGDATLGAPAASARTGSPATRGPGPQSSRPS